VVQDGFGVAVWVGVGLAGGGVEVGGLLVGVAEGVLVTVWVTVGWGAGAGAGVLLLVKRKTPAVRTTPRRKARYILTRVWEKNLVDMNVPDVGDRESPTRPDQVPGFSERPSTVAGLLSRVTGRG
jgi:hypothetical protein